LPYPTLYDVTYSYTGFQQSQGDNSFPGTQLDADLAGLEASTASLDTFMQTVIRSDGALQNGIVTVDSLSLTVAGQLGDTTAVAELIAASAAAVAAATTTAANVVTTTANAATSTTEAGIATTQATAAAASAASAATTLASAVVGPAASVDGEVMLFSGVTGKLAKRATAFSGLLKVTAGVASAATAGTDYQAADPQLSSLIRQNSQSAAYTTVLTDGGKHIFHPAADTTARTWTIDSNANVAYPIGTALTFVNQNAAGVITLAITADTLRLAGAGTTGSRTLAANGIATALKVTATEWIISGTGLA
jgi:hypothetical protein